MMKNKWKILLVDDHALVRSGLRAMLSSEPDLMVVGEASNGKEALARIQELKPEIVVMDLRMPEMNGVDAVQRALALDPRLRIIGLSADADTRLAVELLRAGAMGYVRKEAAYEELLAAIRASLANNFYCSSALVNRMLVEPRSGQRASAFELLSPREREYLQSLAEGKSTKEIAGLLGISIKTAETHRRNLMAKLGVDSVAELVKYAIREGLTAP
jgi:DNA-binding NarL/FixJ family response regulator